MTPSGPGGDGPGAAAKPSTTPPSAGIRGGSGTARRSASETPADWLVWWRWNSEPYLAAPTTQLTPATPAGVDRLHTDLSPQIAELLEAADESALPPALLALARATPPERSALTATLLTRQLNDPRAAVRDAALLALGVLGDEAGVVPLAKIAGDERQGRLLVHEQGGVSCERRQLAALALGLIGGEAATSALLAQLEREQCGEFAGCLLLAAAHAAPSNLRLAELAFATVTDEQADRFVRAQAATALGRMARSLGRTALPTLLCLSAAAETPDALRDAVVIALGNLGNVDDDRVVAELLACTDDGDAPAARQLAYVALGRLLERDAPDPADESARKRVVDHLLQQSLAPDRRTDREWALLGLGLALRPESQQSALRSEAALRLREQLAREAQPDLKSATALALGLMEEHASVRALIAELERRPAAEVTAALLDALGMAGDALAIEPLRRVASASNTPAALRVEAARALARLGDRDSCALVERAFAGARGGEELTAQCHALAAYRSPEGFEPIARLLRDPKTGSALRGEAAAALGELAESGATAWWSAYSTDQAIGTAPPLLRTLLAE